MVGAVALAGAVALIVIARAYARPVDGVHPAVDIHRLKRTLFFFWVGFASLTLSPVAAFLGSSYGVSAVNSNLDTALAYPAVVCAPFGGIVLALLGVAVLMTNGWTYLRATPQSSEFIWRRRAVLAGAAVAALMWGALLIASMVLWRTSTW
jgi:hypothetical protein